jgi:hypothetical protein
MEKKLARKEKGKEKGETVEVEETNQSERVERRGGVSVCMCVYVRVCACEGGDREKRGTV